MNVKICGSNRSNWFSAKSSVFKLGHRKSVGKDFSLFERRINVCNWLISILLGSSVMLFVDKSSKWRYFKAKIRRSTGERSCDELMKSFSKVDGKPFNVGYSLALLITNWTVGRWTFWTAVAVVDLIFVGRSFPFEARRTLDSNVFNESTLA